jgi:hypothetical protein
LEQEKHCRKAAKHIKLARHRIMMQLIDLEYVERYFVLSDNGGGGGRKWQANLQIPGFLKMAEGQFI